MQGNVITSGPACWSPEWLERSNFERCTGSKSENFTRDITEWTAGTLDDMFVGHYAIALAAKRLIPKTSLGFTFLAVQFLDILWAPAILLGIEHAKLLPGFLPASPFVFYDIPWTHGLLMAVGWSWMVFRLSKNLVLGLCVFSHWVLDWIAHARDLPLFRGGPVVGLGLWHYRHATFLVETAMMLIGLLIYLQATRARKPAGDYAVPAFVVFLILLNAINLYGPPPGSMTVAAIGGEMIFLVLALLAWRLDRLREPIGPEPLVRLGIEEA